MKFSRRVTTTKVVGLPIREVPFDWKRSSVETRRGEPSRKRWEFISRARSVFQTIHRHGSRSIENSVARAEMDANKSIGFPNEIKQARETFHPIDDRPPSSLFLFSTPPRPGQQRVGKWKIGCRGGCTVVTPIIFFSPCHCFSRSCQSSSSCSTTFILFPTLATYSNDVVVLH